MRPYAKLSPFHATAKIIQMGSNRVVKLSPRQLEIMQRVARFQTSDAIAYDLQISPKTVDSHIANALRLLEVGSRREGALLILQQQDARGKSLMDLPPVDSIPAPKPYSKPDMNRADRMRDVAAERMDPPLPLLEHRAAYDRESEPNELSSLQRLALIAVITLAIAVVIIAATPMAESFKALANFIEPFH